GVDFREASQHAMEASVSPRTGRPAFDAEAVSLADHVKVRQMREAPAAASGRRPVEGSKVGRLIHAGVGHTPGQ
ncbi:hypothetical protein ADUPG1_005688, partial [Aduncisulcus paluster]